MFPVRVLTEGGNAVQDIVAHAFRRMCALAGFEDVSLHHVAGGSSFSPAGLTLSANVSRLVTRLVGHELLAAGHRPDREQVRLMPSGYLLSELPLGDFAESRYGAPLVNIDTAALAGLIVNDDPASTQVSGLSEIEHAPGVTVNMRAPGPDEPARAFEVYHAFLDTTPSLANVTWLGEGCTAWQFSTKQGTHFVFAVPAGTFDAFPASAFLAEAAAAASLVGRFGLLLPEPAAHWAEGRVVHLGDGAYASHPYRRETRLLGLEDAWVLSRMLENYETDVGDALSEYTRFRKPRAARVCTASNALATSYLAATPLARFQRNVGIALRTRFLPEMAMQRVDWLYQYDCIRGFR